MSKIQLFTSESVTEGHPDKVADAISDAVLDNIFTSDKHARVACETFCTTGLVVVGGEITTTAWVDLPKIVRGTIERIGYTSPDYRFDHLSCGVLNAIGTQSPDIAQGVDRKKPEEQGAGDQGMMFGFACDETPELMPLPILLAHRMTQRLADVRRDKRKGLAWLRPDGKSQVTIEYVDGKPTRVDTVVISTQHDPHVKAKEIRESVIELIIKPCLPKGLSTDGIKFHVNPTGKFVIGGPHGDTGLTGRKIIVDTYGGMGRHGGGAFSGKDPSKVDRSAAYAARWVAKNVVAAGLARRCEVQVAYAIGVAKPVSVLVDTFGTGKYTDAEISKIVAANVDLRPRAIIDRLNLLRPIYGLTSAYGHFGRELPEFTWEKKDLAASFKK